MARLQIEVKGRLGDISFAAFLATLQHSLWILHDLDKRLSGRNRADLIWRVSGLRENSGGIILLEGKPLPRRPRQQPRPDRSLIVTSTLTRGLTFITEQQKTPEKFSTDLMEHLHGIVQACKKDGCEGVRFEPLDQDTPAVEVVKGANGKTIADLVGVHHRAYGSVEGTIELVSIHKGYRKFNLYHTLTKKSIRCNLTTELEPDVFKAAQERRRVVVSGRISYNVRGEPISVSVDRPLRFFKLETELPTIQQLRGLDPNITGNLTVEEYLRS